MKDFIVKMLIEISNMTHKSLEKQAETYNELGLIIKSKKKLKSHDIKRRRQKWGNK